MGSGRARCRHVPDAGGQLRDHTTAARLVVIAQSVGVVPDSAGITRHVRAPGALCNPRAGPCSGAPSIRREVRPCPRGRYKSLTASPRRPARAGASIPAIRACEIGVAPTIETIGPRPTAGTSNHWGTRKHDPAEQAGREHCHCRTGRVPKRSRRHRHAPPPISNVSADPSATCLAPRRESPTACVSALLKAQRSPWSSGRPFGSTPARSGFVSA